MNVLKIKVAVVLLVLTVFAHNGHAMVLPNPAPSIYGNDDGSTLFYPSNPVTSVRGFDFFGQSEFGFFFANAPGTLITIFGNSDSGDGQLALIDFTNGAVIDYDQTLANNNVPVITDTFIPQQSNIGFYVKNPNIEFPLFTLPALNPFGLDLAATFPNLSLPDYYLFGFGVPQENGPDLPLSYHVAINVASTVPEPSTLLLVGFGVAGVGFIRRRKRH